MLLVISSGVKHSARSLLAVRYLLVSFRDFAGKALSGREEKGFNGLTDGSCQRYLTDA